MGSAVLGPMSVLCVAQEASRALTRGCRARTLLRPGLQGLLGKHWPLHCHRLLDKCMRKVPEDCWTLGWLALGLREEVGSG